MKMIKDAILAYLGKYPPSLRLFHRLEETGDIYLIGGVLREFKDNDDIINLRDIDIVIDVKNTESWNSILSEFQVGVNRFGGFKLICSGLVIDIWSLNDTWAYRNHIIKCEPENYVKRLTDTVFLNIDSIVYDMKRDIWHKEKYDGAMKSGVLDVVLEYNPQIPLNIMRALILKKRYSMVFSQKLKIIIREEMKKQEDFISFLMQVQEARYHKELFTRKEIDTLLSNELSNAQTYVNNQLCREMV